MKGKIDIGYENSLISVKKPADKVTPVTLNNPPLNLVTLEPSCELKETLFQLGQDDGVQVAVLTGSGEKVFCVGSDVKEFPLVWDDVIGRKLQKENEVFNAIEFPGKPVIAAVEGNVCGGGYKMAMAYDLRIPSGSRGIAQPETNLGIFPGSGGVFRLPKLVGVSKAMETMFLGGFVDTKGCPCLGLVDRLASAGETASVAPDLVERTAHKPFGTIKLIKKGVWEIGMVSSDKCFYKSLELSRSIFETEDYKERVNAFFGKCSPQFR